MSKAVEKNNVISGWGTIKNRARLGYSELAWPDGTVDKMPILAISYDTLMSIDAEIDAKMPPVPTIPVKVDGKIKQVEQKDDPDYKREVAAVQKERSLRIILKSLPEEVQPEGTLEQKMAALSNDLLAGHIIQLVKDIMAISNLNLEEAVNEAKNG